MGDTLTRNEIAKYSLANMRKRFLSSILILAIVGAAIGVSAHADEGSCPMANMPDCCKKAQSASNTPEVSMARVCCNLNCSEPRSGGSSTSSFSRQEDTVLSAASIPATVVNRFQFPNHYSRANNLHSSNPKYIQHLALLI
jgi:hypothetical protein